VCLGKGHPSWLFPAGVALLLGGLIGFILGSARAPSSVLVPGMPTTLHLYRVDPNGSLPQPGNGEKVIFDQQVIARIAAELNRLPAFPRLGRDCNATQPMYQLDFDYSNGDSTTAEIRPSPCGMVTVHGEEAAQADAVGSPLLDDVMKLLGST
jgi:hypothetical protein